jgi:hypothetical protein
MADLIIKFERIGRTGTTPEAALTLHVPEQYADNADRIAYLAYMHCRGHLLSRDFNVTVDLDAGTISLDGGRYGRGTILTSEAKTEAPS